jgi:hypothetical protein
MFFYNFNAFLFVLLGASYLLSWLFNVPVVYIGRHAGFMGSTLLVAVVLAYIWSRWGFVPRSPQGHQWIYRAGHVGLALSNLILIGAIVLSIQAAAIGRDSLHWAWAGQLLVFGPVACALAAGSIAAVWVAVRADQRDGRVAASR